MTMTFEGEVIEWRGPAPFLFVPIPNDLSAGLRAASRGLTYGWGVIPVSARLGATEWKTSLFPKDGRYLVPVKVLVQRAEGVSPGAAVTVTLTIG